MEWMIAPEARKARADGIGATLGCRRNALDAHSCTITLTLDTGYICDMKVSACTYSKYKIPLPPNAG
jgi:hypothetical protein